MIDIEELRRLHAATTHGEWISNGSVIYIEFDKARRRASVIQGIKHSKANELNLAFISAIHESLPKLLNELEVAQYWGPRWEAAHKELKDARDTIERLQTERTVFHRLLDKLIVLYDLSYEGGLWQGYWKLSKKRGLALISALASMHTDTDLAAIVKAYRRGDK